MKGEATGLLEYMEDVKKHFLIQPYQRNYDWDNTNCDQFLDDVTKVYQGDRLSHFFGSIIARPEELKKSDYALIDGQQRIITVTLLLLAMHNRLPEGSELKDRIWNKYLMAQGEESPKLKSIKNDQKAIEILFAGDNKKYIESSNITKNYKYFAVWIKNKVAEEIKNKVAEEKTIGRIFGAISKFQIIKILLDPDPIKDNPQRIFESLNSTGRLLTDGDKIANFILMDLDIEKQKSFYVKYWNRIENYTAAKEGEYDVTQFISEYLSLKYGKPIKNDVYVKFKDYAVEEGAVSGDATAKDSLLEKLRNYAEQYEFLIKGETKVFMDRKENEKDIAELKGCVTRLNYLEANMSAVRPFLLEVLMLYKDRELEIGQVRVIFDIVESYVLRRSVCGWSGGTISSVFVRLHKKIKGYKNDKKSPGECSYADKLKFALHSDVEERALFPKDPEFKKEFTERPIYPNDTMATYILGRMENEKRRKNCNDSEELSEVDFYKKGPANEYSIEHIMPQTIEGSGWNFKEDEHNKWLHRIGNLTLLTKDDNTSASNNLFKDKVKYYVESGLHLNSYIVEIGTKGEKLEWTSEELEERSKYLKEEASVIWPEYYDREYIPDFDDVNLEADASDFNNMNPRSFTFRGETQEIQIHDTTKEPNDNTAWKEMVTKVIELLYNLDPERGNRIFGTLADLPDDAEERDTLRFFAKQQQERISKQKSPKSIIGGRFYVVIPGSNETRIKMLKDLFAKYKKDGYEIDPKELIFKLERHSNSTEKKEK